jgi:hypothetical protein
MKSSAFYAVLGLGIILVAGIIWWGIYSHHSKTMASSPVATSSVAVASSTPSLTGLSIYTNGAYGFSIFYPGSDKTETTFDTQYHLPATWRVNALPNATGNASGSPAGGTPIFAIIGYSTQSNTSYPRYFETEVRIGASTDPKELAACEKPGENETQLPDAVINKVTWKAFGLQDSGMMQYLQGTSYRTIHDNTCFALEEVETGSSYRDVASSSTDISDALLAHKYQALSAIVQSFSFARP